MLIKIKFMLLEFLMNADFGNYKTNLLRSLNNPITIQTRRK